MEFEEIPEGIESDVSDSEFSVDTTTTDSESDSKSGSDIDISETYECTGFSDDEYYNTLYEMPLSERLEHLDGIWLDERREFIIPEFQEVSGPNVPAGSCSNPVKTFLLLFSEDFLDTIASQTNLYFQQVGKPYEETNTEEMKKFIGINLLMGIKRQPSYRDYWSCDPKLTDEYIRSIMPVKRFSKLLSHIHLADNKLEPKKGEKGYNKLYKVQPLLDTLTKNFKTYYNPSRKLAIDESMIKFKGRSFMKQYMPAKPIKVGYKVFIRSDESGFVTCFQIYTGKQGDTTEKLLGARVVKDLTSDLKNLYHEIYFDNFFNSVDLMIYLKENGILACGTVRKDRSQLPKKQREDKKMKLGEYECRTSFKGLAWVKWIDKKPVHFLSNFHDPHISETCKRKQKNGSKIDVPCPKLANDYNKNMGFVDKMDMLKSLYEISRKAKKWWHRIFWYFVDITIVNSYIIYRKIHNADMNLKKFRLEVVQGLIGVTKAKKLGRKFLQPIKRSKLNSTIRTKENGHMPIYQKQRRRCAYCSTNMRVKRSQFSCKTCNVGLCINENNCFLKYHQ